MKSTSTSRLIINSSKSSMTNVNVLMLRNIYVPIQTAWPISRCYHCLQRQYDHSDSHKNRPWRSVLSQHHYQPLTASFSSIPKKIQELKLSEDACPQGVQGDINDDSSNYKLWLENCRRYGLSDCDQQLQGIQSGRKTLAEVMAEQEKLIIKIAEDYRRENAARLGLAVQGVQDGITLPDINTPCPQGVQGEDCARFKLWLENCHRFRFENCAEQLESYNSGRKTLAEIFEEQDHIIKETASTIQKKIGSQSETSENEQMQTKALSSAQKLRNAVAIYGSTVMVFHVSISLASLGFFYTLVSSGIDVVGLLTKLGIGETILQSKLATGTGTFVVAYAVHKVFAPARIACTLTATPLIVRYLRRIGFLKSPPKKQ